ncbi:DUF6325 family protein [Streptomyces beijiangensis]|uniref:DUF1269 domain-containing protein n=1 Tax=Streptomyces beijiangensis TaxID=163361 RepID=A0A939F787_9ACTN|nr:DUF6325 family protein [Streptomyces beijiangensis]MBO0513846.1 hypothetical protein [Streptomyces beijiangensis]
MGPVEFIVLAFPEEQLRVEAVAAVAALRKDGAVRPIDSLVVTKTARGEVLAAELTEFDELKDVLVGEDAAQLIGPEDVREAGELLENGNCALLVLVEHLWAQEAAEVVRKAGGHIAASVRIPPERLQEVRAALAAPATASAPATATSTAPAAAQKG